MTKISIEEWWETYRPLTEADDDTSLREFDALAGELAMINTRNIWTELSTFTGEILPGVHCVNALRYLVTLIPWRDETLEVTNFITKEDYLEMITRFEGDEDEESAEIVRGLMEEAFPDE